MSAPKFIHWVAVASLSYYVVKSVIFFHLDAAIGDSLTVGVWLFLTWMLFRRPKTWGFGIGIFMLFTVAIQVLLWRLALTSPEKEALEISASWLVFGLSVAPLVLGGICGISLRWLYPKEPNSEISESR